MPGSTGRVLPWRSSASPGHTCRPRGHRHQRKQRHPVDGEETPVLTAGEILAEKSRVLVGTGDGVLEITRIQPPGKKMMAAADWARGRGDLFDDGHAAFDEGEN